VEGVSWSRRPEVWFLATRLSCIFSVSSPHRLIIFRHRTAEQQTKRRRGGRRGRNLLFEQHSQSTEKGVTLDRYYHFHGHLGMRAWLAALLIISPYVLYPWWPSNSCLSGPVWKAYLPWRGDRLFWVEHARKLDPRGTKEGEKRLPPEMRIWWYGWKWYRSGCMKCVYMARRSPCPMKPQKSSGV